MGKYCLNSPLVFSFEPSPQAFTPAGFERVACVEYAQSWLVAECSRPD